MQHNSTSALDRLGIAQPVVTPSDLLSYCHCDGSGLIRDDGSVTDMIGWPLPCACAETIPPRVRALVRTLSRTARPARTALCGGAA